MKELKSSDGRRFRYGRAWTFRLGWKKYLKSYSTVVASVGRSGKVRRLWDGYSKSTTAHVRAFLRAETGREWSCREFYGLPLEEANEQKPARHNTSRKEKNEHGQKDVSD